MNGQTDLFDCGNIKDYISFPKSFFGEQDGKCFAVKISGQGMRGAGIRDGDTCVFRETDEAKSGDIVLAGIGDEELLCRRYLRNRSGKAALRREDGKTPEAVASEREIKVKGVLVALVHTVVRGKEL